MPTRREPAGFGEQGRSSVTELCHLGPPQLRKEPEEGSLNAARPRRQVQGRVGELNSVKQDLLKGNTTFRLRKATFRRTKLVAACPAGGRAAPCCPARQMRTRGLASNTPQDKSMKKGTI